MHNLISVIVMKKEKTRNKTMPKQSRGTEKPQNKVM